MWDCGNCGVLAIAASISACPKCGQEKPMAKITRTGGPSNGDALPGEAGYIEPETADQPQPEAKDADTGVTPVETDAKPTARPAVRKAGK